MKFLMMMSCTRADFAKLADWKPEEFKAHIEFMLAFNERLRASGEFVMAEGLDAPDAARIVRWQPKGPPVVTDGPFAETKEFLAGFWMIDVASRERAIEIAGAASAAPGPGGKPMSIPIELRQVGNAPDV